MNNLMANRMIVSAAVLALVTAQSATSFAQTPSSAAASWTQQSAGTGPTARFGAGIAYDESNGLVLMFGGGSSLHQALTLDDTWQWDGSTWTELQPADKPPARVYASMAQYPGGNGILLFGGLGGDQGSAEPDDESWTWDGENWIQQQPDVRPPARGAASLASDGRGGMVLFGGTTYAAGGTVFDDTWVWDGTTWTQQHPTNNPPARAGASMAPDGHGGVVLFGGTSNPNLGQGAPATYGDLWTWDGANWTQLHPLTSPPGRWDGGMIYNTDSHSVVLFGGDNGPVAAAAPGQGAAPPIGLNDLWSWDGTTWTQQKSTAGPSGRAGAAMAYDTAAASLVVFGGRAAGLGAIGGVLGDTWTWAGSGPGPD